MSADTLRSHLATGSTHVCQCWSITRRDGVTFGFTDHDRPLQFDGITFQADSGLSARALAVSTGLSVDNTEAVGLLQSDVISEEDIAAGRYDGAEVVNWLVRWDDVAARQVRFRGRIGEITRQSGQFQAELRGLAELLNRPNGRTYLRSCAAVLGDARCGVDTGDPAYATQATVLTERDRRTFVCDVGAYTNRWFEQGRLEVLTGPAKGLTGAIKHHSIVEGGHRLTLWHALRGAIAAGDRVRLVAGCDRRAETCRIKFGNIVNFQGFPDMPGDDWLMAVPRADDAGRGESLVR